MDALGATVFDRRDGRVGEGRVISATWLRSSVDGTSRARPRDSRGRSRGRCQQSKSSDPAKSRSRVQMMANECVWCGTGKE